MNIFMTGSGGYIGRGVAAKLLQEGHTVIDFCRSMRRPYASVSLEVPLQTIHTNIDGTASLLEAARLSGIRRVVLYSSDAAYGEHPHLADHAAVPPHPLRCDKGCGGNAGAGL